MAGDVVNDLVVPSVKYEFIDPGLGRDYAETVDRVRDQVIASMGIPKNLMMGGENHASSLVQAEMMRAHQRGMEERLRIAGDVALLTVLLLEALAKRHHLRKAAAKVCRGLRKRWQRYQHQKRKQ
jgi:hypothetical protein